jgi:O-antigen/teichoic acid export membrane protein
VNPDQIPAEDEVPTTAPATGLTTRVVKGSIWLIVGQVAPLAVTFFATGILLRLTNEAIYGVLVLIALIPNYFSYADFGMSMASTKFASGALAEGDLVQEGRIVRTAAAIAMGTSVPVALGIIIFAVPILNFSKVPAELMPEATTALRIAAVTFLLNFLCSIVNTPQLTRLRMDLNTYINAGTRIAGLIATPVMIYLGYGIVGVAAALLTTNLICLIGHLLVSSHLLRGNLFSFSFDRAIVRPLLQFGLGYVGAAIAGVVLMNGEKIILSNSTSSNSLAFYGISFTLATTLTMFSNSVLQSLLPAFAQLQGEDKESHLSSLYSTGVRLNLIWLAPVIGFMFLIGGPFLLLWAGDKYSSEGTVPFFILLTGIAFNILAYMPYSSIMAAGRTDVLAKLFWAELVPYLVLTIFLTRTFGIAGAAMAWSIRAAVDSICQFWIAHRVAKVKLDFGELVPKAIAAAAIFSPTIILSLALPEQKLAAAILFVVSLPVYALFCWTKLFSGVERDWLHMRLKSRLA